MRPWRNWQTRMVQVHVKAISWRFKSSWPHQKTNVKVFSLGVFSCYKEFFEKRKSPQNCGGLDGFKMKCFAPANLPINLNTIREDLLFWIADFPQIWNDSVWNFPHSWVCRQAKAYFLKNLLFYKTAFCFMIWTARIIFSWQINISILPF